MSFQPQERGPPSLTGGLLESETEPCELSAELILLSQFPPSWASCHFHCTGLSLCSASTMGAFAKLGFCCAWPPPCRGLAQVVSARLNLRNGTIYVKGVCNFLGSVSLKQKFEVMGGPVLQLSFIWQSKENTSSRVERRPTQKR